MRGDKDTLGLYVDLDQIVSDMSTIDDDGIGVSIDVFRQRPREMMKEHCPMRPQPRPQHEWLAARARQQICYRQRKTARDALDNHVHISLPYSRYQGWCDAHLASEVKTGQVFVMEVAMLQAMSGIPVALAALRKEEERHIHLLCQCFERAHPVVWAYIS